MTEQLWASVDQYFTAALVKPDEALDAALRDSDAAGLPPINVTPNQGKLLHRGRTTAEGHSDSDRRQQRVRRHARRRRRPVS